MKLVAWILLGPGAAVAVLAPASAGLISAFWGRDVTLIAPEDPALVELNRSDWSKGKPVAELYGTPVGKMRVVFPDPEKLVVPAEDPSLTLYKNSIGDHPLQAQTLWFFAVRAAVAAAIAAAVGGAILLFLRRRSPTSPPPGA